MKKYDFIVTEKFINKNDKPILMSDSKLMVYCLDSTFSSCEFGSRLTLNGVWFKNSLGQLCFKEKVLD